MINQFLLSLIIGALASIPTKVESSDIFSVQVRASTPNFQLFTKIDGMTGDPELQPQPPLFSPAGGVYAMAFHNKILYAIELDNGGFADYLATIPHEGPLIGQGSRVGNTPVGFPNIEGLASVADGLIASSLNFETHRTDFIDIDSETGTGALIGSSGFNEMIVGMAFDPVERILYGAGIPFGDPVSGVPDSNLYRIEPQTGATTLIGNLGVTIQGLAWDPGLGLIGGFDRFYTINKSTGLATPVGEFDYTDGLGTGSSVFNGLFGLAAIVPTVIETFSIIDINLSKDGRIRVEWEGVSNGVYQLQFNPVLSAANWTDVGDPATSTGLTASQSHLPSTNDTEGFYRVIRHGSSTDID